MTLPWTADVYMSIGHCLGRQMCIYDYMALPWTADVYMTIGHCLGWQMMCI